MKRQKKIKIDILELSNPINDKKIKNIEEDKAELDISIEDTVNEDKLNKRCEMQ